MWLNDRPWMLPATWLQELTAIVPSGPRDRIDRKLQASGRLDFSPVVTIDDGVAIVVVDGVLTRRPEFFQAYFDGVSTELLAAKIEELAADRSVDSILLRIDSPGGEASGMPEVAAAIADAAKAKQIVSVADRLCASGAYYLASQTSKIYAGGADARVGSIGTLLVAYDWSERFATEGIKPIVIATGQYKGMGAPGTEFTDAHLQYLQGLVDETQTLFASAVQSGRKLSAEQVAEVADGRVFTPAQAKAAGLIDGTKSFGDVLAELKSKSSSKGEHGMTQSDNTIQPATFEDLMLLPGVSESFVCEQLKAKQTLDQATSTHMEMLVAKIDENAAASQATIADLQKQVADLTARLDVVAKGGGGVDNKEVTETPGGTIEVTGDPVAEWRDKVTECAAKCGGNRARGAAMAAKQFPAMREAAQLAGAR